ncbi:MAG: DUF1566 domain-containing protein [Saprospiraceae bacterium]|nr:DUF1566 domain-containing protein [Saprospiraceae bacterium]
MKINMKYHILLLLVVVCCIDMVHAQAPQAFNYSGVARDAQGDPIANTLLGIEISILQGSAMGPIIYQEEHMVMSDNYGLFNIVIGLGTPNQGSMESILWSADAWFLQVALDVNGGNNYVLMGATQLLSVPYALHAQTADSVIHHQYQTLSISNDTIYLTDGGFVKLPPGGGSQWPNLDFPEHHMISVSEVSFMNARFTGFFGHKNPSSAIQIGFSYDTIPPPFKHRLGVSIFNRMPGDTSLNAYIDFVYPAPLNPNTTYYVTTYIRTLNDIWTFGEPALSFTTKPLGELGPGGGILFFDKGEYKDGWRYMEALPMDLHTGIAWGCSGTELNVLIGCHGLINTDTITFQCPDLEFAAKICSELVYGGMDDWYLPCAQEMDLMKILYNNNYGNLNDSGSYWTSEQEGDNYAGSYKFIDGNSDYSNKSNLFRVRPIRRY